MDQSASLEQFPASFSLSLFSSSFRALFRIGLNLGSVGTRPCDTPVCDYFKPWSSLLNRHAVWSARVRKSKPC
ncbi:hypothetical protein F383_36778 [Gossypium arboreum]|uniref:Uncharacterized protein n=1 Tax=Gossypium arboreum TaxID=29729 RepID=A0A0B0MEN0_GOSAR|nr:hypothetical protein F383_36778 [Gossypium arboreum]